MQKNLQCQHTCIGLCGEKCPRQCRTCDSDKVKNMLRGAKKNLNVRFIQLTDSKHIFEVSYLDKWMGLRSKFCTKANNESHRPSRKKSESLKGCPKFSTPIMTMNRYGNQIRAQVDKINQIKSKIIDPIKDIVQRNITEFSVHFDNMAKQLESIDFKEKSHVFKELKWSKIDLA